MHSFTVSFTLPLVSFTETYRKNPPKSFSDSPTFIPFFFRLTGEEREERLLHLEKGTGRTERWRHRWVRAAAGAVGPVWGSTSWVYFRWIIQRTLPNWCIPSLLLLLFPYFHSLNHRERTLPNLNQIPLRSFLSSSDSQERREKKDCLLYTSDAADE